MITLFKNMLVQLIMVIFTEKANYFIEMESYIKDNSRMDLNMEQDNLFMPSRDMNAYIRWIF
jgi:hypothetical protein